MILLRGGDERLEVLLVQRNPSARFMGGAWVFPGGAVDKAKGTASRRCAPPPCESSTRRPASSSLSTASWCRSRAGSRLRRSGRRFDTWFFLAICPEGAAPRVDGAEVVDFRWTAPADALAAGQAGELLLVFPTIKQLEQLDRFGSAEELLAHARGREVQPIQPQVVGGPVRMARIVLPGEPGYDA